MANKANRDDIYQPLSLAIHTNKSYDFIKQYLEEGASPDGDGVFNCPLELAILRNKPNLVQLLLIYGAKSRNSVSDIESFAYHAKCWECLYILLNDLDLFTRTNVVARIIKRERTLTPWMKLLVDKKVILAWSVLCHEINHYFIREIVHFSELLLSTVGYVNKNYIRIIPEQKWINNGILYAVLNSGTIQFLDVATHNTPCWAFNRASLLESLPNSKHDRYGFMVRWIDVITTPWAPTRHCTFSRQYNDAVVAFIRSIKKRGLLLPNEMIFMILYYTPWF